MNSPLNSHLSLSPTGNQPPNPKAGAIAAILVPLVVLVIVGVVIWLYVRNSKYIFGFFVLYNQHLVCACEHVFLHVCACVLCVSPTDMVLKIMEVCQYAICAAGCPQVNDSLCEVR